MSRLLHRLALGSRMIAETSFDIDQMRRGLDVEVAARGNHVFIAGLARAGTTLLLRGLHDTGAFRSLIYRDMPFVLMPKLWRRISAAARREQPKRERPHGDGIWVDLDSPEALEEVFWRVFSGRQYIHDDRLLPMSADQKTLERFRRYVAAVLDEPGRDKPRRYLSKNNNNILRLDSIQNAFPAAALIIPFRDPLQQTASLLAQHRRFRGEGYRNDFTRRYMRWLVHHEFGADHRRFRFRNTPPTFTDPDCLDYWLDLWTETYDWLLETRPAGAMFLSYDAFASDIEREWPRLARRLALPTASWRSEDIERKTRSVTEPYHAKSLERAVAVHERLHSEAQRDEW